MFSAGKRKSRFYILVADVLKYNTYTLTETSTNATVNKKKQQNRLQYICANVYWIKSFEHQPASFRCKKKTRVFEIATWSHYLLVVVYVLSPLVSPHHPFFACSVSIFD